MHCAAFIAYSLAFAVYAYRVQLDQNGAAFRTYADNRVETITAEHVFTAAFRMFPERNIFCFTADMA